MLNKRQSKERGKFKLWRHRGLMALLIIFALFFIFLLRFASQSISQTNAMIKDISECKNGVYRDFIVQDMGLCEKNGQMIIMLKKDYNRTLTRKVIVGAGDEGIRQVWEGEIL